MSDPRVHVSTQPSLLPHSPMPSRPTAPGVAIPAPVAARSSVRDVRPAGYPLWELPAPLRSLFERLDAAVDPAEGAVPLEVLSAELDRLGGDHQMLAPWWFFDAVSYRRNLIRRTGSYEALLLCWQPGQKSPIHDHCGSGCAFRVIQGVVTETLYERTRGDLVTAVSVRWLPHDTVCASRDFDIHQVANAETVADLVTLHVYSPPLANVNTFRCADVSSAS